MICEVFWCLWTFVILKHNTLLQLRGVMFFRNDICHSASCSQLLHCWRALWCRSAVAHFINVTATFFSFPKHLVCVNRSTVEISVLWGLSLSFHCQATQGTPVTQIASQNGGGTGHRFQCCYSAQDRSTRRSECAWDISSWPFYMILWWGKMQQPVTKFCWQPPCSFECFDVFTDVTNQGMKCGMTVNIPPQMKASFLEKIKTIAYVKVRCPFQNLSKKALDTGGYKKGYPLNRR